ncbi:MAG: amidohydrolase family protein [Acidimicrobiia bacterium]
MPLAEDVQLISVDDHIVEGPKVWEDRLPKAMRDAGPRVLKTPEGYDAWHFEGARFPYIGINAVVGREPVDFGLEPMTYSDMRPGCYEVADRITDMDRDGVHAQLCFPSFPGFCGKVFFSASDKDLAAHCVRAWNDFSIDEWCSHAPDRFIPLALIPFWDPAASAKEIERVAAKGARAISFSDNPTHFGLPSFHSDHWDPILAAAHDADLPLCLHFGSGGAPVVSSDAPFIVEIAQYGLKSMSATAELLLSPVFHKFPRLKVALSEGGVGWMPYILERLDYTWERHRWYQEVNREIPPSELFRDHIFGCFISDASGVRERNTIGVENLMWESDYPHSDGNWPNSRTRLAMSLKDVPDDDARQIAELNARRVFRFPRSA